jgi:hypothetical protein
VTSENPPTPPGTAPPSTMASLLGVDPHPAGLFKRIGDTHGRPRAAFNPATWYDMLDDLDGLLAKIRQMPDELVDEDRIMATSAYVLDAAHDRAMRQIAAYVQGVSDAEAVTSLADRNRNEAIAATAVDRAVVALLVAACDRLAAAQ